MATSSIRRPPIKGRPLLLLLLLLLDAVQLYEAAVAEYGSGVYFSLPCLMTVFIHSLPCSASLVWFLFLYFFFSALRVSRTRIIDRRALGKTVLVLPATGD